MSNIMSILLVMALALAPMNSTVEPMAVPTEPAMLTPAPFEEPELVLELMPVCNPLPTEEPMPVCNPLPTEESRDVAATMPAPAPLEEPELVLEPMPVCNPLPSEDEPAVCESASCEPNLQLPNLDTESVQVK